MQTNLLAIPLVSIEVQTGTNEDWVDSLLFLVDGSDPSQPQLDLRGIYFEMEVRRQPEDHEVIIRASTKDGTLLIGDPPNFGFLIINVPMAMVTGELPGIYYADIRGSDDENTRVVVEIDLEIVEGITR
jgi:hypothetical protein